MHDSCQKVPYPSQLHAELALAALRMKSDRRERRETGSCMCSVCSRWHLTSKSRSQVHPWRKSSEHLGVEPVLRVWLMALGIGL